jgi:hypothetical protein
MTSGSEGGRYTHSVPQISHQHATGTENSIRLAMNEVGNCLKGSFARFFVAPPNKVSDFNLFDWPETIFGINEGSGHEAAPTLEGFGSCFRRVTNIARTYWQHLRRE